MATRWACLGPGKISSDFFKALQENLPSEDHEFVAVASRDQSRAQQFADKYKFKRAYGSYDEVAKDKEVEVVYIGTLHTTHADLSMKMLEAGKHVLSEKPMAMNYKQAKKVLDFAKSKNLLFMEGIWSRFFPVYDEVRKELAAGSLGDIKLVQASFCLPLSHVERLYDVKLGGGASLDIGLYTIQFACFVYNNEMPESITAVGNLMESGADESVCVILKYKNGAVANLTYNASVRNENTAVICGTKGRIQMEQPFWCPTKISTPSGVKEFPLNDKGYNFDNSTGFQYEAKAVRDCLLKGLIEHPYVSHKDSETVHKILDEVRRQIGMVYPDFD